MNRTVSIFTAITTLLVALAIDTPTSAQGPSVPKLVKDINTSATATVRNPASTPNGFSTLPARTYFAARSTAQGTELWGTLGLASTTNLVMDINPGPSNSYPAGFHLYKTAVYFAASTATAGREVWKTDGSTAGTVMLKDMIPGGKSANPGAMIEMGGVLYILLGNAGGGAVLSRQASTGGATQLWKSDGTTAGTVLVKDIAGTGGGGSNSNLIKGNAGIPVAVLGSTLLFAGLESTNGGELWKSDGTTAGTVLVKDIFAGTGSSNITGLITFKNRVLFSARSSGNDIELWITDGTGAGTVLLKDIYAGTLRGSIPREFIVYKTRLYFTATDSIAGRELWSTDATATGTPLVKDIRTGLPSSSPLYLTIFNNLLYFRASDATTGIELFKSDGTATGTGLAADLRSGTLSSAPGYLTEAGGSLYFSANLGVGSELYKSNGTLAGTSLVKDINTTTGTASSVPAFITKGAFNNVIFRANDGVIGSEPWVSDGTAAGTFLLKDINPLNPAASSASSPNYITPLGDKVVFIANDGTGVGGHGVELWISDGTPAGTTLLKDIRPGTLSSSPAYLTFFRGKVYFRANDGTSGSELWETDGTPAGTVLVKDIRAGAVSSAPFGFTDGVQARFVVMRGVFYFRANSGSGNELFRSDGTAGGTGMLKDINTTTGTASSNPNQVRAIGNLLYFYANDGSTGNELWISNGSTGGTVRLADIRAGAPSSSPAQFTALGNKVVFRAFGATGQELYITDGTPPGTVLLKDINTSTATAGSAPASLVTLGNIVLFRANDGTSGSELWKTDGTPAGTVRVKDIQPGVGNSTPNHLRVLNNKVLFRAIGPKGTELYETDGTTAGTKLLKDVDPYGNGNVNYLLRHGSRHLWFTATTTVHGSELHRTDGTASGTIRVGDINPGDNNSLPFWTTLAGGKIYFRANDGVRGNELYVVELPGATAMPIGTGCPDGAAPTMTADDPELGGSITLQVAGAPATVAGMMFVTLPEQGIHLGFGCVLYVNPAAIAATIAFATSGSGSYSTGAIPVPNTPALAGVVLNAQSGVTDLAVPPLGVALTNGLALTLGK